MSYTVSKETFEETDYKVALILSLSQAVRDDIKTFKDVTTIARPASKITSTLKKRPWWAFLFALWGCYGACKHAVT